VTDPAKSQKQAVVDGRYAVRRRLGEGAFGAVYLCEDLELGRSVAIKVLHPGKAGGQMQARFRREAQAAAMLRHPNVVTVYGQGVTSGGEPYLVTEFIDGETLSDRIRSQGLPHRELARQWIRQLAEALGAAHAQGVVHRDVKPANILLDGDDAKLADFGLARIEDEMTRMTETGQIMGTPIYMAPEVFLGEEATARADVYSLAAIAYRILYGQRWRSGGLDTLIEEARKAGPPPEDRFGTHPDLDPALIWGLQPKPADRAPSADAFLEAFLGEEEPPPPAPPTPPPSWQRPAGLAAGALVLLLVGLGWTTAPEPSDQVPAPTAASSAKVPKSSLPEPERLARARLALKVGQSEIWEEDQRPTRYTKRARALLPYFMEPTMPLRYKRLLLEVAAAARAGASLRATAETLERVADRWWDVENGLQDDALSNRYEEGHEPADIGAWHRVTEELQDIVDGALDELEPIEGGGDLVRIRLAAARIQDTPRSGKAALQAAAHLPAATAEVAVPLSVSLQEAVVSGNAGSRLGPDGDLAVVTWLGRTLPAIEGREPTEKWVEVAGNSLYAAARTLRRRLAFTPPEGLVAFDRLFDTLWSFRDQHPKRVLKFVRLSFIRLRGRSMIDKQEAGEVSVRAWMLQEHLKELGDDPAEW
jgi:serine/threonine protein kinase